MEAFMDCSGVRSSGELSKAVGKRKRPGEAEDRQVVLVRSVNLLNISLRKQSLPEISLHDF